MSDAQLLTRVLTEPGDWTFAYVDGHGDEPVPTEEERRRSVRDRLADAGAAPADVDAMDAAMRAGAGIPSPSTRYLLAKDGEIVMDEQFVGERLGPEQLGHGVLPPVLPLLRHRSGVVGYLVVETGREGARVHSARAGRVHGGGDTEIEGRTDTLSKVPSGGWAQRNYQTHTEEIWKQNQSEVADVVERMVRDQRPRFVVVAGDVRARGLLIDALSPASRELVVDVDAHTKADGADDDALDEAIAEALQRVLDTQVRNAQDRAAADDGALRAEGVDAVTQALQQARVDTLLLDARLSDAEHPLTVLDAAPWVTTDDAPTPGASAVALVPMAEALVRAAVLTDAAVLVLESEPAPGEPRPNEDPSPPEALLRWAENPG